MSTDPRMRSLDRYLLDWLAPALFALLVSVTIRFHSLAPMPTMPRMVGDLLALADSMLCYLAAAFQPALLPEGGPAHHS